MGVIYAPQKSSGFNPLSIIGQVANVATGGALTPLLAGAGMISGLINGDYAGAGLSALAGATGGLFGKGVQNGLNNMFGTGANAANAGANADAIGNAVTQASNKGLSGYALGNNTQIFDGGSNLASGFGNGFGNSISKYKPNGSWS